MSAERRPAPVLCQLASSCRGYLEYNKEFVNRAPFAVAMLDRHMRYLAVSSRWLSDYTLKHRDVLGSSHYEVFPNLPDRLKAINRRCLAGLVERGIEERLLRENGQVQWINWEVQPWFLCVDTVEIGGIFIFSEDISEFVSSREKAKALKVRSELDEALRIKAERLSNLKDDFIATLSHELREPLNSLLGWVTLLRRIADDPERVLQAILAIEKGSVILAYLVSDIMDANRIASGKLRINTNIQFIAKLVEDAIALILPEATSKNITVKCDPSAMVATINCDEVRIKQCLSNLLANAIKFTPEGGHVDVTLRQADSMVVISVRDDGIGIASETLPHVFERLMQVEPSNGKAAGGLGLGLSIVKHLIEAHGGRVYAASAGLGQGSEFTIELPVAGHAV